VKKVQQEIKVLLLTNMSINTKQGTIAGDKMSTGNKCLIADKRRPSIQNKLKSQVTKVQQEIKILLVTNDRPSIPSKIQSHVTNVQWQMKVLLVPKDRSFIQNKVKSQVTKV
jgi:hypothetical protein